MAWWVAQISRTRWAMRVIGVVQQIDTNDRDHPGAPVADSCQGGKVGIDCGITEQGQGTSSRRWENETSPIEMLATESRVR